MFYYRINKNHALIQYNKQDLSNNIKSIDYLEFEIKEHKFKLLPYHINILLEEFKEDTTRYSSQIKWSYRIFKLQNTWRNLLWNR